MYIILGLREANFAVYALAGFDSIWKVLTFLIALAIMILDLEMVIHSISGESSTCTGTSTFKWFEAVISFFHFLAWCWFAFAALFSFKLSFCQFRIFGVILNLRTFKILRFLDSDDFRSLRLWNLLELHSVLLLWLTSPRYAILLIYPESLSNTILRWYL